MQKLVTSAGQCPLSLSTASPCCLIRFHRPSSSDPQSSQGCKLPGMCDTCLCKPHTRFLNTSHNIWLGELYTLGSICLVSVYCIITYHSLQRWIRVCGSQWGLSSAPWTRRNLCPFLCSWSLGRRCPISYTL